VQELVDDIQDLLDGQSGAEAIGALITVLKIALECAPSEKDRLSLIDDMVKYLREADYATQ
jgi:hypothetical protein